MTMKILLQLVGIFILGGFLGVLYDALAWQYQLPYIGLNWLGPLIGADGERGYDAMLYECILDFGSALVIVFLLVKFGISKLRENREFRIHL
jgi:hypothetical protein